MAAAATGLRSLMSEKKLLVAPGVFDAYTARIIESLGFEAIYLGGNALGLQLCIGQPFVTASETVNAVSRIRRAVGLPIIVDAGAGFGDAAHTFVATRELERAGASAIHIDDQVYPKRAHYHRGVGHLSDVEVVVDKLAAAVAARRDPDFMVIARTDALRVTGSVDQTIARAKACAGAGVDAVLVLDLGIEAAAEFRAALPGVPLVWMGGIAEPVPLQQELESAGFSMALYPFNTAGAITEAVLATWQDARTAGRPARPSVPTAQSVKKALSLIDMERLWDIEARTTEKPRQSASRPTPEEIQ